MDGIEPIGMPPILPPLEQVTDLPRTLVRSRQTPEFDVDLPPVDGAISPAAHAEEQKKRIARDFESVLLSKLFDQVQESTGDWGLEEEDTAGQQVKGLFWMYLAREAADQGGLGLWKDIYQYFTRLGDAGNAGAALDEEL